MPPSIQPQRVLGPRFFREPAFVDLLHRGTDTHDYMWTTPSRLYLVLDNTLRAYDAMRDQVGLFFYIIVGLGQRFTAPCLYLVFVGQRAWW